MSLPGLPRATLAGHKVISSIQSTSSLDYLRASEENEYRVFTVCCGSYSTQQCRSETDLAEGQGGEEQSAVHPPGFQSWKGTLKSPLSKHSTKSKAICVW